MSRRLVNEGYLLAAVIIAGAFGAGIFIGSLL